MGIKYLNGFLRENCKGSIRSMSMAELSGKKIAVDVSIYLYKYAGDESLVENMYLMISTFRHYNIIPIFIFDGKPPAEKKELLNSRRENKQEAEKEYKRLKGILDSSNNDCDKLEIVANMDALKKKFIYVSKRQIELVKELMVGLGVTYYDAPGEADELCATLVLKKKVWGCMSEDMDLFAYGCTMVLRYFSLINRTVVVYFMKEILQELGITQKEFREICVLSGTDYNISKDGLNFQKVIKYFRKYKKIKECSSFYDWINQNFPECIEDYILLQKVYEMFDLSDNNVYLKIYDSMHIENLHINKEILRPILRDDGFVFRD